MKNGEITPKVRFNPLTQQTEYVLLADGGTKAAQVIKAIHGKEVVRLVMTEAQLTEIINSFQRYISSPRKGS